MEADISRRGRFHVGEYITDRRQPTPSTHSTPHFSVTTSTMPHTNTPPTLTSLPAELLLKIAAELGPSLYHLASLIRTSRGFAALLSPELLKYGVTALDRLTTRPLLHWAAARDRSVLLAGLLRHGADVSINFPDRSGATPLHSAVICGSTAAVAVLLRHGADPHVRNSDGWAALHLAAITGHCRIVGLLLDHGADISARSSSLLYKLPFHYAVLLGHVAVTEIFLARGADVNEADSIGMTVAQKVAVAGHSGVVRVLFGAPEAAMDITQSAGVVQLVPLVGMETSIAMRHFWGLVETEAHAARFRGQ